MFGLKNLIFIGIGIGFFIFGIILTYSRDISLPYHVWVNDWFSTTYSKGEYVIINYSKKDPFFPHAKLIKRIMCVGGEMLVRIDDSVFCNRVWLGNILKESKDGRLLPQQEFNQIIPKGEYFVSGTHERSYDSRYFGPIPESMFIRKVIPLSDILSFLRLKL